MAYDPKCQELAEHFLDDQRDGSPLVRELAQQIQDCVEEWVEDWLDKTMAEEKG